MQDPALTVKTLLEQNWSVSVTDPPKASVGFYNTYFDPNGKIRAFQISVPAVNEVFAGIAMGTKPKYQATPTLTLHVWTTVLPGKPIATAMTTHRNMLDEIIRIIQAKATSATELSFLGQRINVVPRHELGETGEVEERRLHSVMSLPGIYFKM